MVTHGSHKEGLAAYEQPMPRLSTVVPTEEEETTAPPEDEEPTDGDATVPPSTPDPSGEDGEPVVTDPAPSSPDDSGTDTTPDAPTTTPTKPEDDRPARETPTTARTPIVLLLLGGAGAAYALSRMTS